MSTEGRFVYKGIIFDVAVREFDGKLWSSICGYCAHVNHIDKNLIFEAYERYCGVEGCSTLTTSAVDLTNKV